MRGTLGVALAAQGGFQALHGRANGLRVAAGAGRLQSFGGVQHALVVLAQGGVGLLALGGFAVEGVVNRLAKRVPQFLLKLALQRHGLRLVLPTLLQAAHRVDAHHGLSAQRSGFFDHGLATHRAGLLLGLQRRGGGLDGFFIQGLQLGKHLLAHMTTIAPAVGQAVQGAGKSLPLMRLSARFVGGGEGLDVFDEQQALGFVFGGLSLDFFQPGLDHFVGLVAGVVKALPQRVVGHAALVGGLPLLAQGAQGFLHLAATVGLAFGHLQKRFRLAHQLFAQLVGTPALPAFQLARSGQRGMGLVFQRMVDQLAVFLELVAQLSRRFGRGLAVAFAYLLLQF